MFGILLITVGTLFSEVSTSLGKHAMADKRQDVWRFGFLSLCLSTAAFVCIAVFVRGEFIFSIASLPTLSLRIALEVFQTYVAIRAVNAADRSTYGFLRVGTIPLLLLVDFSLGYPLSTSQIFGIGFLVLGLLSLFLSRGLSFRGVRWVLLSTVNAVLTLSLYKYDITHFNSVETEQSIVQVALLICCTYMVAKTSKINPFRLFQKPLFLLQSLTDAFAGVLVSFGYLYMPASVATGLSRASAVLFSIVSGNRYFHEKKLAWKIVALFLLIAGFVFLAGLI